MKSQDQGASDKKSNKLVPSKANTVLVGHAGSAVPAGLSVRVEKLRAAIEKHRYN